jgi:hypothetical protein
MAWKATAPAVGAVTFKRRNE